MLSPSTYALPRMTEFIRSLLLQAIAGISDFAGQRAGGDGKRAGEVNAGLLVAHAAVVIAVGGADATQWGIEPAKRVAGAAQTRGATGWTDLGPGRQKHLFQGLPVEPFGFQSLHDVG